MAKEDSPDRPYLLFCKSSNAVIYQKIAQALRVASFQQLILGMN